MQQPQRIIVGISGASGAVYGARMLNALHQLGLETHLVITKAAELTLAHETEHKAADLRKLASFSYGIHDLSASIASGSFQTLGMVVAPCSVKSLAEIATGVTSGLLARAADVTLKERRRLVLMLRETPLHSGHLRNMLQVTEMGGIIAPPVPAFYARPMNLMEMVDHSIGRVLDLFGLDTGQVNRWGEDSITTMRNP